MDFNEMLNAKGVDFEGIDMRHFLLGMLSAFDNRYQACADSLIGEITWKQFFAIICLNLCNENPTINELSEIMGSSHQNVKQILIKLEKKGFVRIVADEKDKRKQRIELTEYCEKFCNKNDEASISIMNKMFEGISPEQIQTTIATIIQIEGNLKGL